MDGLENRRELLPLPQHHAGGNHDLGVTYVLCFQTFEQAAGDQSIVFGGAQALADCPESAQKSVEIGVMIESAIFLDGSGGVELVECFGLHRTFQVEMQFRFGHVAKEIVHT